MRDVVEVLDVIDLAVARSVGVLPPESVDRIERRAHQLRDRRGYAGDVLVLGIAGGTGSGKSSLLNAMAGVPVASVSHLRPHTDVPLAWIPESGGSGLRLLLDELEIEVRVTQDRHPHLALIDLPDFDSITSGHRQTVERLVPAVDGIVWLFDPEKYRDRLIHEQFLAPLADHGDQFVFALNKVDLIDPADVPAVTGHLVEALVDDGFSRPSVFALAAGPPGKEPLQLEGFRRFVTERLDAKRIALGKLLSDAAGLLHEMGVESGTWSGASIGLEERWERDRQAAAAGLLPGAGPGGREDALCRLEDLVAIVGVDVGPSFGGVVRSEVTADIIAAAVDQAAAAAAEKPEGKRRISEEDRTAAAAAVLDAQLGDRLRALAWRRAVFGATVALGGVGVAELRERLGSGAS
jgi:hypothetical protein